MTGTSATISEHISAVGVHASDIRPRITRDVENFEKCSLDEMLREPLVDCCVEPRESFDDARKTRLLEECLEKVLPICNCEVEAKNKRNVTVKSSEVKKNLVECLIAHGKREDELYPLFVTAANVALFYLQELKIDAIRPLKDDINNSPICFHVHDPSSLRQYHQGKLLERKPDVIVVSESDVRAVHGSEQECYNREDILRIAMKAPNKQFGWRSVRTFVEFKRSTKKVKDPPDWYIPQETTPPQEYKYLKMDVPSDESEPDGLHSGPASFGGNPRQPPPEPVRRSARQQEKAAATNSNSRKRPSEHLDRPEPQSKRPKSEYKKSHPVIVQAGYYAAELFGAHPGRQHVTGLVVGDVLYVWRYDRQGVIQCSGLNFIQGLSRFLVLLLAMQRFEPQHRGLNPYVDPQFGLRPVSHKTTLRGDERKEIEADFGLSDENRVTHFGLNGRATNLFHVECKDLSEERGLIIKMFWTEVARMSEPEMLKKVHEIAETHADVRGHVPEMLWYKTLNETSTGKIRERLGLSTEGARVLCEIIFRKLMPVTELHGDNFLHAWWATVKCHLALWQNGVYHRDISESNLMYRIDEKGKIMGVLNDFDLASTEEIATGTERTGTVPFMVVKLLDEEALDSKIKHSYEHDAESFIWVLTWIALRYTKGKLKGDRDRPLDEWLKVDATGCMEKKNSFLNNTILRRRLQAGIGHEENWELAEECIFALKQRELETLKEPFETLDIGTAFERFLRLPVSSYLQTL